MFTGCDIVHYHALGPALFSFLPRCAGTKTVVTVQGLDWRRSKWNWMASAVLHVGEKAANDFPNATITVSRNLHEHYRSKYLAETFYVPNGAVIRSSKEDGRLKQWGLESGKYILFLGRLSPEKNCHLLIEAYESLKPAVKLVLAGGSSYSDSYADELRRHRSDQIRVLNFVSGADLDELLTNAGLFVLPSDIEGLSLAILDAMGAGVCVLVSDIPENREVVDGAGYTFKAGDIRDLERMLRLLIENPLLGKAAAIKARERIQQSYLWPQVAKQIEEIYLKVLDRKLPPDIRKLPISVAEGVELDNRVA
jgi:glycosyltransferase involved in cell wall biosynthesis